MSTKHLTSNRQDWETPNYLFNYCQTVLNAVYEGSGPFTVDLAAENHNKKVEHYLEDIFAPECDLKDAVGFMNPPFSNKSEFVARVVDMFDAGNLKYAVLVLPSDPSTVSIWGVLDASGYLAVVLDVIGRVAFIDPETLKPASGNSYGTTLAILSREHKEEGAGAGSHIHKFIYRDDIRS